MSKLKKVLIVFFISLNFCCVLPAYAQLNMGTINSVINASNAIQAEREEKEREEKITVALVIILLVVVIIYIRKKRNEPNPDTHVKCPDCKELVLKDARKCKHCGCNLIAQNENIERIGDKNEVNGISVTDNEKLIEEKSQSKPIKKKSIANIIISLIVAALFLVFFQKYIATLNFNSSTTSTAPKIYKESGDEYNSIINELNAEGWTLLRSYVDFKFYKYSSVQYDAPLISDYINQNYPNRVRSLKFTQCVEGNKNPPTCNGKNTGYRVIIEHRNIDRLEADMKRNDNKQVGD